MLQEKKRKVFWEIILLAEVFCDA